MKVDVYRNLNDDCLSILSRRSHDYGTVVEHRDIVVVEDVEFVVQDAGRRRVLDEEKKNVHAFVRGNTADDQSWRPDDGTVVTYDPYKFDSFVEEDSHDPVTSAECVLVRPHKVEAVGLK